MYHKVATDMNFVSREKAIAEMWKKKDIIRKSFHHRDGSERFTFYDGPPTANGKPHIGHIETRVIKDLIPRFWTMKGKSVLRKAGWDTHGLPVELEVEKALGVPAGGAGGRKGAGPGRQAPDRTVRHRALYRRVQEECVEIPARVGKDVRTVRVLGGHGKSVRHL